MTGQWPTTRLRFLCAVAVCALTLTAACTSTDESSSLTSPSASAPSNPAPSPAAISGSVEIAINPNPVPFSGQPITNVASCSGSKNTWFYDQVLRETGGAAVVFTSRVDKFDGRIVNTLTGLNLAISSHGSLTIASRWCSSQAVAHTAQTTFTGTDEKGHSLTIDGPVANLRSP